MAASPMEAGWENNFPLKNIYFFEFYEGTIQLHFLPIRNDIMKRPRRDDQLRASDTSPILALRQGKHMGPFDQYELAIIDSLREVEKLTQNLAEGAALNLSLKDEFLPKSFHQNIQDASYGINNRGRLWQIHYCLEKINDALKALPVEHLSIHTQAFHRAFMTSQTLQEKHPHHASIQNATATLIHEKISRPQHSYLHLSWVEIRTKTFTFDEAQHHLLVINEHLSYLVKLLRHSDVKKHHRLRKNQSKKHEETIKNVFNQSFKKSPEVLFIFLDLSTSSYVDEANRILNEMKGKKYIDYHSINEARKNFLKKRNHHPLFNGLINYVWKYRYTHGEGITCMMLLIYNAVLETQQYSLTHALGKYWESVAGQGSSYKTPILNSNQRAQEQYFGLLKKDSEEAQRGIDALARFMGLYQMYVKPESPKNMHTFGTSSIKKTTNKKKKNNHLPKKDKGKP
ncbi:inovirus-type Gp2 protein [Halomonas piscis]|uniref:Inovirus-type Gp2 protein n=1 Tax=Halomonas piscis TaxID=3031727 RepID=A0ABY9Z2U0_9GAMM|nr:inovirus-type Gp2 protein [Halomonas piscis]WNK21207.1 inovirus-type Gp2 protein [Halomonas piscis]